MKRSEILFGILRIPLDMLAALAALILAYRLREANIDLIPWIQLVGVKAELPNFRWYLTHFALPWTGVFVAVLASEAQYALKSTLGPWKEMGRVIIGALLWVALMMAWFFLVQRQLFFSRALLVQAVVLLVIFSLLGRTLVILLQRSMLRRGVGVRTVLSCGTVAMDTAAVEMLGDDIRYRYLGHVMNVAGVAERIKNTSIDLVLHTDANAQSRETEALIEFCRSRQIGYAFLPPVFADVPHLLSFGSIGLLPLLRFEPTPLDGWGRVFKRLFDLVFGLVFLLILSPLLLLVSLMILLSSGWPIFYRSTRVGQYGERQFPMLKFRTMCRDADAKKKDLVHLSHRTDGPLFKIKDDPRVTPLGKVLRRFSIDELPQLLNVLAGHLSLIGPRPHLPEEVQKYHDHHRRVFTVRPGITGLAQISGRSNLGFEDEVRLDMRYIEEWSLSLDLWILWRTFFVVVFGRGAD